MKRNNKYNRSCPVSPGLKITHVGVKPIRLLFIGDIIKEKNKELGK